eukprot:scaffold18618_cov54-Skeletonema_dohrnii-CCMP3373.AAC.2
MRGNGLTGVYSASRGGQLSPPPLYSLLETATVVYVGISTCSNLITLQPNQLSIIFTPLINNTTK